MIKKTFLVTGGLGFIGSAIVKKLSSQKKYEVVVFDNLSRKNRIFNKIKNVKYIFGDIRKLEDVNKCFKNKIDAVVHLAYINGTSSFYKIPCDILEVGTKGIINLLDICLYPFFNLLSINFSVSLILNFLYCFLPFVFFLP